MASTFSPSLKLELIGDGDQSGIWGQTTNINLGTLLEQAITGVVAITMVDANYTLTSFNGVSDEARNAVLVVGGTNNGVRDIITPLAEKLYVVKNSTTGGYAINIRAASGSSVAIPNGGTVWVYCDGTNFNAINTESVGNFDVNGNLTVTGNTAITGTTTLTGALGGSTATFSGAISSVSPAFTGVPTAPNAANGTSTTQIATTAFVNSAVTIATNALGTMSTQNANAVAITGGNVAVNTLTSSGTTRLAGAGTIRSLNFGSDEISWNQSGSTLAILNISDANGNNGSNYNLLIRGLQSNAASAVDLTGITLAASTTTVNGVLNAHGGLRVPISPSNTDGWLAVNFTGPSGGSNDVFVPGSSGTYAWWFSNRGGGYIGIGAAGSYITTVNANNFFGFAWKISP